MCGVTVDKISDLKFLLISFVLKGICPDHICTIIAIATTELKFPFGRFNHVSHFGAGRKLLTNLSFILGACLKVKPGGSLKKYLRVPSTCKIFQFLCIICLICVASLQYLVTKKKNLVIRALTFLFFV